MEFAAFYNRVGVEVHVIEMLPEILGGMDSEMGALLRAEYTKLGVKFYLQHKVTSVAPDGVTVEFEDNSFVIPTERILLSVGRRPVTEKLSPLGLEMEGRGVKVDATMRTSLPGVYAAGDVTGYSLLAHTAVREAEVAVDNMLGKNAQMSYRAIPGIIYTQPEVAGVGMTEDQLKKRASTIVSTSCPWLLPDDSLLRTRWQMGCVKSLSVRTIPYSGHTCWAILPANLSL